MNFDQYKQLDQLISQGNAGGPERLAKHIGISKRSVKHMISVLKERCGAPIEYNRKKRSYYYSVEGKCHFYFSPNIKQELTVQLNTAVSSIIMKMMTLSYLYLSFFCDF